MLSLALENFKQRWQPLPDAFVLIQLVETTLIKMAFVAMFPLNFNALFEIVFLWCFLVLTGSYVACL